MTSDSVATTRPVALSPILLVVPRLLTSSAMAPPSGLPAGGPPGRALVILSDPEDIAWIHAAQAAGHKVEALIGPGTIGSLPAGVDAARFSADTPEQIEEFALALSDALLCPDCQKRHPLALRASELGKQLVEPGSSPDMLADAALVHGLDPGGGIRNSAAAFLAGRIEQLSMECLALRLRGDRKRREKSFQKIRDCFWVNWRLPVYFAPEGWRTLVPDTRHTVPGAALVATFERLDRSALFGASLHRDSIWVTHIAAAFAVLFAVLGAMEFWPFGHGHGWALLELVALGLIGFLIWVVQKEELQKRWMALRLAAEQLRIARLCLPLLVVPLFLQSTDRRSGKDAAAETLSAVKRAVRDQGVPAVDLGEMDAAKAAKWVRFIVADQADYHRKNEIKLGHAEERLHFVSKIIFSLAVLGVLLHFFPWDICPFHLLHWHPSSQGLLVLTAAMPAFAAALHGAGTRLGIVHRIELSADATQALDKITEDLAKIDLTGPDALQAVRRLAQRAAEAMGTENNAWHHLVRRQEDHLPA